MPYSVIKSGGVTFRVDHSPIQGTNYTANRVSYYRDGKPIQIGSCLDPVGPDYCKYLHDHHICSPGVRIAKGRNGHGNKGYA